MALIQVSFNIFGPNVEVFHNCCIRLDVGIFSSNIDSTHIALTSKGDEQKSMKDWRSIILCNIIYKVVAKVLANMLKGVL